MDTQDKKMHTFFTNLIEISKEIHDSAFGSMNSTLWMVRLTNLQASFIKSKNPMGWADMFLDFYEKHSDQLTKDIFMEVGDDTMKVNDDWLKTTEFYGPEVQTGKVSGWSPSQAVCKGHVLYLDPSKKSCSFPLTEVYLSATKLHKTKGSTNVRAFSYPARVLYNLYEILTIVLSPIDGGHEKLVKNANVLKQFIDEISPSGGESDMGEGIRGLSKIMSQVMKSAGVNMDASKLESTVGAVLEGDGVSKLTQVAGKFMQKMNDGGEIKGPEDLMDKLGDALRDKDLREAVGEAAGTVSGQLSGLVDSIPTAESVGQLAFEGAAGEDGGAAGEGGSAVEPPPADQE